MLFHKKHLLVVTTLSALLTGCQGSLAYELMQAGKNGNEDSQEKVENTMPIVEEMKKLPSEAELATRKMQPRKWGAFSLDDGGNMKMIWVTDKAYNTPDAASADVIKQCRKEGGRNCKTAVIYSNLCFALAQGRKGSKPLNAYGYGPTGPFAKKVAVANCKDQGGQSCEPVPGAPASCATPCNLMTDKSCRYEQPAYIFPGKNGNRMQPMPSFFGKMGG